MACEIFEWEYLSKEPSVGDDEADRQKQAGAIEPFQ